MPADRLGDRPAQRDPDGLEFDLVRGPLPPAIEDAGRAAADTPYACLLTTRAFAPSGIAGLHHLVIRDGGRIIGILSFLPHAGVLEVVNECVALAPETIGRCAERLFSEYGDASRIAFRKLRVEETDLARGCRWPSRIVRKQEDHLLALPATFEEYLNAFSARARQKLRNYERHLQREFPNVEFARFDRDEVDAAVIRAVVQLNHLRMEAKGGHSLIDDAYTDGLVRLARACGVVSVYRVGERIIAGTVCTQVGDGWSLEVIAHDPALDHLSLGTLCLLHTVRRAIASGASTFHLLWGKNEYKLHFGGKPVSLLDVQLYRRRIDRQLAWDVIIPAWQASVIGGWRGLRRNFGRAAIRRALRDLSGKPTRSGPA